MHLNTLLHTWTEYRNFIIQCSLRSDHCETLTTDEKEAGLAVGYCFWNLEVSRKTSEKFCKVFKLTNFGLKKCRISCNWFDINSHDGGIEFDKKLMIEI